MLFFLEKTWPFWLLAALLAALIAWVIHRWRRGPRVIAVAPKEDKHTLIADTSVERDLAGDKAQTTAVPVVALAADDGALDVAEVEESAPVETSSEVSAPEVATVDPEVLEPKVEPVALVEATPVVSTEAPNKSTPDIKDGARVLGFAVKLDDLKVVEGIGPKIEGLLRGGGISTWQKLADTPVEQLQKILNAAGKRYQVHNPATWPRQAEMLANGEWAKFKVWTEELTAGREK